MILARLARSIREQDWLVVAIEFVIVVAGILLALQVDQWAEQRAERALEREYLHRLVEDLEIERAHLSATLQSTQNRVDAVHYLERVLQEPDRALEEPARVPWAIETVSWRAFPRVNGFVFRELQSTGRLILIRSVALRRALAEHYAEIDQDERVGVDLSAQRRFEAATAGLATTDELISVEMVDSVDGISIEAERAREMVVALAERPAATAELPSIAQHQVFNRQAIEEMLIRTDALIEQIHALIRASGPST